MKETDIQIEIYKNKTLLNCMSKKISELTPYPKQEIFELLKKTKSLDVTINIISLSLSKNTSLFNELRTQKNARKDA